MQQDSKINHNDDIHEESTSDGAGGASILEEMPSYDEHMVKMANEVNSDGPVVSDTFLEFEEAHPELGLEMRENNVPLNEADFKAGGYEFYRDEEDGKPHVKVQTEEFKDWKKVHSDEPPMWLRRFVSLREQSQDNKTEKTEDERREFFKKKVGLWTASEQVESACKDLFPDRVFYGKKKWKMFEEIPRITLRDLDIRREKIEKQSFAAQTYKLAAKDTFADSRTVVPQGTLLNTTYGRLNTERAYSAESLGTAYSRLELSGKYYADETPEIVQEILRQNQAEVLGDAVMRGINKLTPEMKQSAEKTAAEELINAGDFMQEALVKDPNFANETLQRLGIDKNQDKTTFSALGGYEYIHDDDAKKAFAEFFKLEDRFAEMIDGPDGKKYFGIDWRGEICRKRGEYWAGAIPDEIAQKGRQKIDAATSRIVEWFRHDERFADITEKNKRLLKEGEMKNIRMIFSGAPNTSGHSYDLGGDRFAKTLDDYLGRGGLVHDELKLTNLYINQMIDEEKLGYLINRKDVAEQMGITRAKIEMDYPGAIKDALVERLRNGVGKVEWWAGRYYSEKTAYLTDVFRTKAFLDNQESLGLDFGDQIVKTAALEGLVNTLTMVRHNDERKFEQANWYVKNFFAENPEELVCKLKAYNESGLYDKWAKGQVTKFLGNNTLIAEHMRETEERGAVNRRNRAIPDTILISATPEDVRGLIRRRQEELIGAIEKAGAEKIKTFRATERGHRGQNTGEGATSHESLVPINFGLEKIGALRKYYDFIDLNVPGASPHYFVDSFPGEEKRSDTDNRFDGVKLDDDKSYVGFTFEYEGRLCVVAESFNDDAAMYLYCGEPGSNYKEMFDGSKNAAVRDNPNVAKIKHIDRENIGDSLDTTYKKAFMFFRTEDKRYTTYGNKSEWIRRQKEEFPAWPLGIMPDYKEHQEEIERYRAWQARQAEKSSK